MAEIKYLDRTPNSEFETRMKEIDEHSEQFVKQLEDLEKEAKAGNNFAARSLVNLYQDKWRQALESMERVEVIHREKVKERSQWQK